eukprot:XP_014773230.1 PREDICTED: uncharacterized protein LOC106871342 [Octopus bimaculoides]
MINIKPLKDKNIINNSETQRTKINPVINLNPLMPGPQKPNNINPANTDNTHTKNKPNNRNKLDSHKDNFTSLPSYDGRFYTRHNLLAETRIHRKGNFVEKSAGYQLFWSGREETYKRESGVGFAIKTTLASKLEELPCGHSDRLMSLRLPLRKGRYATLISEYAPSMNSSEDDKLAFYLSLTEIICNIPHDDKVVILGDINARIGADWETWRILVSSKVAPLQSKDGTELLTNPKDIVGRWKEHFDELLNRPTKVGLPFLDNIP